MEQNNATAVLKPTKTGNGYKIRLPNGSWVYASKRSFQELVNGQRDGCTFQPIQEQPRA